LHFELAAKLVEPFVEALQIGEGELCVNHLDVVGRVHPSRHMDDIRIIEAAHDMGDHPHLADVREKLVTEAFALRCPPHEPRDIHELDDCRHFPLGLENFAETIETLVWKRHDAKIRIDRAKGIIRRLGLCP